MHFFNKLHSQFCKKKKKNQTIDEEKTKRIQNMKIKN